MFGRCSGMGDGGHRRQQMTIANRREDVRDRIGHDTKCQRCLTENEARYRAYTDMMEIDICTQCAEEARRLGISLASLITASDPAARSKTGEHRGTETPKSVSTKRFRRFGE